MNTINKEKDINVCILLAHYNGAKYLKTQLNSLKWQNSVSVHIFISDACSSNDELNSLKDLIQNYVNVEIIFSNIRLSPCQNFFKLIDFVKNKNFDYYAFCDQDDIWSPNKLIYAINLLKADDSSFFCSDLISYSQEQRSAHFVEKNPGKANYDFLFQGASAGCTYVLTKKAMALLQKIDFPLIELENLSHDWLIYAICRSHGLKCTHSNVALVFYRQHLNNSWGSRRSLKGLLGKLSLIRNKWYRDHIISLKRFIYLDNFSKVFYSHLESNDVVSRIWLIRNAAHFRNSTLEVIILRILFLLKII